MAIESLIEMSIDFPRSLAVSSIMSRYDQQVDPFVDSSNRQRCVMRYWCQNTQSGNSIELERQHLRMAHADVVSMIIVFSTESSVQRQDVLRRSISLVSRGAIL